MKRALSPPGADDLIQLLRAWRFWVLGTIVGALAGTALFYLAPPPYRARATVLVDFHLEEAWPQNTDREQFYYLERETRKLEEVAMSDATLDAVARGVSDVTIQQMRLGKLNLSQPGNGGWHFYAEDADAQKAVSLAAAWAQAFTSQVESQVVAPSAGGLEPYITVDPAQTTDIPANRSPSLAVYMSAGAMLLLVVVAFGILFFDGVR
jgi:capsular polysaccharide biosynthesis protein